MKVLAACFVGLAVYLAELMNHARLVDAVPEDIRLSFGEFVVDDQSRNPRRQNILDRLRGVGGVESAAQAPRG